MGQTPKGRVSSPTHRRQFRGVLQASLHAGHLLILRTSTQDISACSSHDICGRPTDSSSGVYLWKAFHLSIKAKSPFSLTYLSLPISKRPLVLRDSSVIVTVPSKSASVIPQYSPASPPTQSYLLTAGDPQFTPLQLQRFHY